MDSNRIFAPLSFLTIFPVPRAVDTNIDISAENMHLFPLIGAFIGTIIGIFAYGISMYFTNYLVGFFVTLVTLLITGMHHTDALADLADGLMVKGSKELKRQVMEDPALGAAGTLSLVLYVIGLIFAITTFNSALNLLVSIITAEVIAKYVMVIEAGISKSAWEGFSTPFTKAMKDKRKLAISTFCTVAIIVILTGYYGLISLGLCLIIGLTICIVSDKNFGGLTGDVLGASNEICRLSSLLILSQLLL
ncbi:MAG TPA: adenosylcobinamide-GDP ribazoletransferase [Nitrososphaeraceae archaeon]